LGFGQLRLQLGKALQEHQPFFVGQSLTIGSIILRQQIDALTPQRHCTQAAPVFCGKHRLHQIVEAHLNPLEDFRRCAALRGRKSSLGNKPYLAGGEGAERAHLPPSHSGTIALA
jgi:hypothetical protein